MSYNGKTLLWLLLCFPVGLTRMWRSRCSWKLGAKYAVSSLAVIAMAAVLAIPSPFVGGNGGVTLYGEDPSVEIYGPELPESYRFAGNAPVSAEASVIVSEEQLKDTRYFVYAGEKCYHLESCQYYSDTCKKLTLYEAYFSGYKVCNVCQPPVYSGGIE